MGHTVAYPPEFRARALELYVTLGAAETARRMGLPRQTVQRWANRGGVQTRVEDTLKKAHHVAQLSFQAKRVHFRERLLDMAARCVEDIPGCDARDRQSNAVAAGILVDKLRLELGESTSRTETHSTIAHLDHELERWVQTVRSDTPDTPSLVEAQARDLPTQPLALDPAMTETVGKEGPGEG